jgi:hypothetical protein
MTHQDIHQQGPWQNHAQWSQWSGNPQYVQGMNPGIGQAAYGQQAGPFGTGQYGGGWGQPGGQRQLSQQDIGEVVRQVLPLLPQILAQSQAPLAAFGYGNNQQRQLSPQDIGEVVRQLLPILPQIMGAIQQGQAPMHAAAMYGGYGQSGGWQGSNPYGQPQSNQGFGQFGFGQFGPQSQFGQFGPPIHAAFGGMPNYGQRQLSQQDASEVVRQLISAIPQVVGNLQAYGQRLN